MRRLALHGGVLGLMALVAVAFTWPLAAHLGSRWAVRVPEPPDPSRHALFRSWLPDLSFGSWMLASGARQLTRDPLHLFDSNNLHPFRHSRAFGENLLGVTLLVLPVQLYGDNPVLTFNVAALLSVALAGWGTFLLVRELTGSTTAGLVTGILTTYSPSVWGRFILLPVLAAHWTPIALFLVVRLLRERRVRWAVALGIAVAWQVWSSLQHGLFLALGLAVSGGVLLLVDARARRALPHLLGAGALAALLCVPLALPYRAVTREMDSETRAGAAFFSLAPTLAPPFRHPLAYLAGRLRSGERAQGCATLGPWLLVLCGLAVAAGRRREGRTELRVLAALGAGGLANLLFAFGPIPHPWLPGAYGLVTAIPGLGWVRVPHRATAYAYLVLCVVAGAGLAALLRRAPGRRTRGLVVALTLASVIVEGGWRSVPLAAAPPRQSGSDRLLARLEEGCAIAELPAGFYWNGRALFRSTSHWRPLLNGFAGFYPIAPLAEFALLNAFPSSESLDFLRAAGVCAVVIRPEVGASSLAQMLAASRDRGLIVEDAGTEAVVHVPPAAPLDAPAPLAPRGWRVEPAGAEAAIDGDLATVWHASAADFPPDRLTVDLGVPAHVTGVTLELGPHVTRYLRSYRVEGSADGTTWTTLAESPRAVPPLASYRADWQRVRQQIAFPPAAVRFLRIGPYRRAPRRGLGPDVGWSGWVVAELTLDGAPADSGAPPSRGSRE